MQAGGRDGKKLGLFPLVTLDDQPPRSARHAGYNDGRRLRWAVATDVDVRWLLGVCSREQQETSFLPKIRMSIERQTDSKGEGHISKARPS
jgi:hypothetical protein